MIIQNLSDPLQVLHKLEREIYRTFHNHNYVHKSDHFYNFCITASSLRDYVLHYLKKKTEQEKQPYYLKWSKVSCLIAVRDIANISKHFVLKYKQKTKAVKKSNSNVISIFIDSNGKIKNIKENVPDYKIIWEDGRESHLYKFTQEVIDFWKKYLADIGVNYIAQEEKTFFGYKET